MKKLMILTVIIACSVALARAGMPSLNEKLAGTYSWSVPGSTWKLSLTASGDYSLTTQGGLGKPSRPIESGIWLFEGFTLVLKSKESSVSGSGDYRKLHVLEKKSGQLLLVSALRNESYFGQPFGDDILFDYVFLRIDAVGNGTKKETNQPSQS